MKKRPIGAAVMAAVASLAVMAPLALGDGGKATAGRLLASRHGNRGGGTMRKSMRAAATAAVLSLALLALVLVGRGAARAGVSLSDFCGD